MSAAFSPDSSALAGIPMQPNQMKGLRRAYLPQTNPLASAGGSFGGGSLTTEQTDLFIARCTLIATEGAYKARQRSHKASASARRDWIKAKARVAQLEGRIDG